MLSDLIDRDRQRFLDLCRTHKVKELYAFGSAVHGPFTPESDVDLLLNMIEDAPAAEIGERLWSLLDAMESFFSRHVDLVTDGSIRNPIRKRSIDQGKRLIYDGSTGSLLC